MLEGISGEGRFYAVACSDSEFCSESGTYSDHCHFLLPFSKPVTRTVLLIFAETASLYLRPCETALPLVSNSLPSLAPFGLVSPSTSIVGDLVNRSTRALTVESSSGVALRPARPFGMAPVWSVILKP